MVSGIGVRSSSKLQNHPSKSPSFVGMSKFPSFLVETLVFLKKSLSNSDDFFAGSLYNHQYEPPSISRGKLSDRICKANWFESLFESYYFKQNHGKLWVHFIVILYRWVKTNVDYYRYEEMCTHVTTELSCLAILKTKYVHTQSKNTFTKYQTYIKTYKKNTNNALYNCNN